MLRMVEAGKGTQAIAQEETQRDVIGAVGNIMAYTEGGGVFRDPKYQDLEKRYKNILTEESLRKGVEVASERIKHLLHLEDPEYYKQRNANIKKYGISDTNTDKDWLEKAAGTDFTDDRGGVQLLLDGLDTELEVRRLEINSEKLDPETRVQRAWEHDAFAEAYSLILNKYFFELSRSSHIDIDHERVEDFKNLTDGSKKPMWDSIDLPVYAVTITPELYYI